MCNRQIVDRFGRRWPLVIFHVTAGVALALTFFIPEFVGRTFDDNDQVMGACFVLLAYLTSLAYLVLVCFLTNSLSAVDRGRR